MTNKSIILRYTCGNMTISINLNTENLDNSMFENDQKP